jgi:serine/threonine-protein kinase
LKPANLFLANRADGGAIIKVLDFGISKAGTDAGVSAALLTGTAVIMGSPLYMSPEQLRSSRDVDARTDIWSLGILLFELLTGQTPFVGETVTEIIANIMTEDAPPLSSVCPEASPELDAVLALCLAKKRDKRYESVADFAQELAPFGTAAAAISAEHIRRVLRVSLSARDSLAGGVPTARLSAAKTVRDPTLPSAETVGRSTEDPVSVGAKTAPDFVRPADVAPVDDVAAAIAAIAKGGDGDTAISPGAKAAAMQRGAAASGPGPETAPPSDSASKRAIAIAAGTIVVGLLAIAGVTASRRGPGEPVASGDPSARVATLAPASASAPSGGATEAAAPVLAPAPSSVPALTVVDAAASASASARGGPKGPPPKPGAATGAAPATTAPAVAPPPATTTAAAPATTAAPPATTTAPKPGNPLDKLDKVQ